MIVRVTATAALLAVTSVLLAFATPASAQTASQAIALIGQKSAEMTALQNKGVTGAGETAEDRRWRTLAKEIKQLSAALLPAKNSAPRAAQAALMASDPKPAGIMRRGQDDFRRDQGLPPLVAKPKTLDDFCSPAGNFYVRADRLDTYLYGIPDLDEAKGASISYTNDRTNGHQTANVEGFVSYVIARGILPRQPDRNQGRRHPKRGPSLRLCYCAVGSGKWKGQQLRHNKRKQRPENRRRFSIWLDGRTDL